MVGKRLFVLLLSASLAIASCKRAGSDATAGGVDAGNFDKAALLRAFGECSLGNYRQFAQAAVELETATKKAEADGTPASRELARAAWIKAMEVWQRTEAMQYGPAAMTGLPGGQDLRDPVYAWPLVSRCLVEQQLVAQTYDKPDYQTALVSTRGMGAIEYLLFYDGADNACPPTAAINAQGTWNALGEAEIKKRRLAYARVAVTDVVARSQKLVDAWDPAKGNFVSDLASAGNGKPYPSQQMALNAVSDAMFFVDDLAKNMKVGKPAGLTADCATPPCLDAVESPWAKRSKEHLRNNLLGLDALVRGCGVDGQGLGFDDLLVAVGADATRAKLSAAVAAARAALDALTEATFEDDLKKNPAGVKALFDALGQVATVMKSEFITILDLELPKKVEGDND